MSETVESNQAKYDKLREVLQELKETKPKPKGGLIPDPTRQLAKKLYELETRIDDIEKRLNKLGNEVSVYIPLGGEEF